MYQHLPLREPPKFTQIGKFGLKINHLATLIIAARKFSAQFDRLATAAS
jgi:hypothetical protein